MVISIIIKIYRKIIENKIFELTQICMAIKYYIILKYNFKIIIIIILFILINYCFLESTIYILLKFKYKIIVLI